MSIKKCLEESIRACLEANPLPTVLSSFTPDEIMGLINVQRCKNPKIGDFQFSIYPIAKKIGASIEEVTTAFEELVKTERKNIERSGIKETS